MAIRKRASGLSAGAGSRSSRMEPLWSYDLSYVIAAYSIVIGSLLLYGLWLQAGRRAVARQEAGLLAGAKRASGKTSSDDSAGDGGAGRVAR